MDINIQLLSDLHLEYDQPPSSPQEKGEAYSYEIPVQAGYLALLGDSGCTCDDRLFNWLDIQLGKFRTVFYLSGNHEAHGSSLAEANHRLAEYSAKSNSGSDAAGNPRGRFVFLNRTRFDLTSTITILGCTLWGPVNPASPDIQALNDFKHIRDFTPETLRATHEGDLAWLNSMVSQMAQQEPERTVVVFTHHAPTVEGTSDPANQGRPTSAAFASELTSEPVWATGNVKTWAFGHTHWCCDFMREGVRVYSNQKGRSEGVEGFDACRVLTL